jgi:hypothetical protein
VTQVRLAHKTPRAALRCCALLLRFDNHGLQRAFFEHRFALSQNTEHETSDRNGPLRNLHDRTLLYHTHGGIAASPRDTLLGTQIEGKSAIWRNQGAHRQLRNTSTQYVDQTHVKVLGH